MGFTYSAGTNSILNLRAPCSFSLSLFLRKKSTCSMKVFRFFLGLFILVLLLEIQSVIMSLSGKPEAYETSVQRRSKQIFHAHFHKAVIGVVKKPLLLLARKVDGSRAVGPKFTYAAETNSLFLNPCNSYSFGYVCFPRRSKALFHLYYKPFSFHRKFVRIFPSLRPVFISVRTTLTISPLQFSYARSLETNIETPPLIL